MARKRFAVIGLGRFGMSVATALFELGAEVLVIDKDRSIISAIQDRVTHAVTLDATQKKLLEDQGVDTVDCAIVGIGEDFEANVLTTSIINEFKVPEIITRCYNEMQKQILRKIGATQVISPEEDMGKRLAKNLISHSILDFLELPEGFEVKMVETPRKLIGKTLAEAAIRTKYMINIVAIQRMVPDEKTGQLKKTVIALPGGEEVLGRSDILGIIGKEDDIERFV